MLGVGAASSPRDSSSEMLQAAVGTDVDGGSYLRDQNDRDDVREVRGGEIRREDVEGEAGGAGFHRCSSEMAAEPAALRARFSAAWGLSARV